MTEISNKILRHLYCPITRQLFQTPILASDEIIYESDSISKWLTINKISPTTKREIVKYDTEILSIKNIINQSGEELKKVVGKKADIFKLVD